MFTAKSLSLTMARGHLINTIAALPLVLRSSFTGSKLRSGAQQAPCSPIYEMTSTKVTIINTIAALPLVLRSSFTGSKLRSGAQQAPCSPIYEMTSSSVLHKIYCRICLFFGIFFFQETISFAQVLPKGVGAYTFGYRQFLSPPELYDANSELISVGDRFNISFKAADMASGKAGSDLKKLYDEMRRFDSENANQSIADQADFGALTGNVNVDLKARFLGVGYGITEEWTGYLGIPFVSATVETSLNYGGRNNAKELKDRLGGLAYQELQDGLDKASTLSADSFREAIEVTNAYEPLDKWSYSGLGDVFFGARRYLNGERKQGRRLALGLMGQVDLPTGGADDPNVLTDVPIGKGYAAVTFSGDGHVTYDFYRMGVITTTVLGVPTKVKRRVPEGDDSLVPRERLTNVDWSPGPDLNVTGYGTYGNALLRGTYSIGLKKHFPDQYNGSLDGNYGFLEKDTNKHALFHEIQFMLTTTKAFAKGAFSFPFILTAGFRDTFAGKNAAREKYFELTLASFFSTPFADNPKVPPSKLRSKK
jgi:hypothetical protein